MPTLPKTRAAMRKHLSDAEEAARAQAEREALPDRGGKVRLKKPPFVGKNRTANAYWNQILRRMDGLVLLDDLDSEMLAGYCSMLARRDQTILLIHQLVDRLGVQEAVDAGGKKRAAASGGELDDAAWEASGHAPSPGLTPDELIEAVGKLDALTGKLQSLERNLLQYADKLGLTPAGRVRLAQRRAEQAAGKAAPEDELYGD